MSDDPTGVGPADQDEPADGPAVEPESEPAVEPAPVSEPEPEPEPAPEPVSEPQPESDRGDTAADVGDVAEPAGGMTDEDADRTDQPEPAAVADAAPPTPGRRRLAGGLVGASALIGVLFALLGFALAVQVHTNSSTSGIASARQDDLVRILDDLSSREDRLRKQIASLQAARRELSTSGDKASVALAEARNRSTTLAILAGTAPARGPGVRITINDPGRRLDAEDLLDVVEELRAAGAEAFQVGSVRIGMSSAFTEDGGVILADGTPLRPPYVVTAIGDPGTLATALNIPGGVVASVRNAGGQATVTQSDELVISALRPLDVPQYASPATRRGN